MRGWANYYRHVVSKRVFCKVDTAIFQAIYRWTRRGHPNKGAVWIFDKYFKHPAPNNWWLHAETRTVDGQADMFRLISRVLGAEYWTETTNAFFAAAPYHAPEDPHERVLAYVDFRRLILQGKVPEFTCLVGTMVQDIYDLYPAIRDACNTSITSHAATLVADIAAAAAMHGVTLPMSAESLALHTQTVIQGAFVLANAGNDVAIAADSLGHLRRYIELLFQK